MRPSKVTNEELIKNLATTIRKKGYDGASLSDLEKSSGLKKASLYHRFPEGKQGIGLAVLQDIGQTVSERIFTIMVDKSIPKGEKLSIVSERIREFYDNGDLNCIINALSMQNGLDLFQNHLNATLENWISNLTILGVDCGYSEKESIAKAIWALNAIQGSLILCRTMKNTLPFDEAMKFIKHLYNS